MKSTGQRIFLSVVSFVFVAGVFGSSASAQLATHASVTLGNSDLGLTKKHDGGKPRVIGGARASLPVAAQPGISAALGRDDSRYHVRAAPGGFHAENPEQALTTEFTAEGIEVRSRTAQWGLSLRGYGYGDALQAASAAAPQATANRVEYRRGTLTEWYVNGPLGVEQGFTLRERPGQNNGKPLTIALDLSKGLTASLDPDGKGLTLASGDGQPRARYAGLVAYDAVGRELRSWAEVRGEDLLLHIDDAGARYPLVVDPFIQLAKLTASDGAMFDGLGSSVAISSDGSTLLVEALGFNSLQGAAYVFVRPPSGWASTSSFAAKLTASDGVPFDVFGSPVSISGDGGTVAAGAQNAKIGANSFQGAAYVFVRPATGWVTATETAKLTASDGAAGDGFGAVSISGDGSTVVAGAAGATIRSNSFQGAVYVFERPATGWTTTSNSTAKLTASDGVGFDGLGAHVAISGDGGTVVAGAAGSNSGQGAAYVFVKPGTGWATETETAKLTASDGAACDALGFSVSISSDDGTVVAGAQNAKIGANSFQGAAYVFVKPGTGWATETETAKLTASDGAACDLFGLSVSISGDGGTVVAGAPFAKIGSSVQGAAYVFVKPGTGWASTSTFDGKLTPLDGATADFFGSTMAISGDAGTVAGGAPFAKIGSNPDQGAAYVFGAAPADFRVSARPRSETVEEGDTATYTIGVTPVNGFTGTVALSCAGGPPGSTCTIVPASVTLNGTRALLAMVRVSVPRKGPEGTFRMTFTGTSGALKHSVGVELTVD